MKNETYVQRFLEGRARLDLCMEQYYETGQVSWLVLAQEELKKSNAWRDKLHKKLQLQKGSTTTNKEKAA
jgi:hypothetical protein